MNNGNICLNMVHKKELRYLENYFFFFSILIKKINKCHFLLPPVFNQRMPTFKISYSSFIKTANFSCVSNNASWYWSNHFCYPVLAFLQLKLISIWYFNFYWKFYQVHTLAYINITNTKTYTHAVYELLWRQKFMRARI